MLTRQFLVVAFVSIVITSMMMEASCYDGVVTAKQIGGVRDMLQRSITALQKQSSSNSPQGYACPPSWDVKEGDIDQCVKLIHESMTTPGRVYHALPHVFDISGEMEDPILLLSALFHDIIYFSIDQRFTKDQANALEGVLMPETQQLTLAENAVDPLVDMVVTLYGFQPGEPLPKLGTNEFLSAMVGVRVLSKWLTMPHLIQIAACIEATIPFRSSENGVTPMDRLYDRLSLVTKDQTEEWRVGTVRKAAITANYDLSSFDSTNRDFFMDSSWKLMPEARPVLLQEDCSLGEFLLELKALQGRTKFLQGAVPRIFQSFRGSPSDAEMEEKRRMTYENLDVVVLYSQIRLLQVMVLVDFVEVMGEDPHSVPLRSCLRMEVPLSSDGPAKSLNKVEREIRDWLVSGRRTGFSWDPASSPLAALLYDTLGPEGVEKAVDIGKSQDPGSHELLKFLPKSLVWTVASRLGAVLPDRAERLLQVPEKLGILAQ